MILSTPQSAQISYDTKHVINLHTALEMGLTIPLEDIPAQDFIDLKYVHNEINNYREKNRFETLFENLGKMLSKLFS